MEDQPWRFLYRAKYVGNYDGDTCDLVLDLGLDIHVRVRVRVAHLWCPEMNEEGGAASRDAARAWMGTYGSAIDGVEWPLMVELHRTRGKETRSFVRYIGDIYDSSMKSFAEWMVGNGHGTAERLT